MSPLRRATLLAAVLLAGVPGAAAAQRADLRGSENLVVRLRTVPAGADADAERVEDGSGLILAVAGDTMVVATAAHVVCGGARTCSQAAGRISAWVRGDRDVHPRTATLHRAHGALDVAILLIPGVRDHPLPHPVPRDRLRGRASLREGLPLYPVGCVSVMQCWEIPVLPAPLVSVVRDGLVFRAGGPREGYSGGGVFTGDGELVGMIVEDSPYATDPLALSMETVLGAYGEMDPPVEAQLHTARIPLRGYRTKLGITPLLEMALDPPSGTDSIHRSTLGIGVRVELIERVRDAWSATVAIQVTSSPAVRVGTLAVGVMNDHSEYAPAAERAGGWKISYHARALVSRLHTREFVPAFETGEERYGTFVQVDDVAVGGQLGVEFRLRVRPHLVMGMSMGMTGYFAVDPHFAPARSELGVFVRYAP